MDVHHLHQLLEGTLTPDQNIRHQAEEGLKAIEVHDGVLAAALEIMASGANQGVQKSAAVFFKNRVKKGWVEPKEATNKTVLVGPNDRVFLSEHIVNAISELPTNISTILRAALEFVLEREYQHWHSFLPTVVGRLQSDNPSAVFGGLTCIYTLLKAFEYDRDARETVISQVVASCYPIMLSLSSKLIALDTVEAGSLMRMIVKIYCLSIRSVLIPQLQETSSLVPWGQLMVQLVQRDIPQAAVASLSEEDREKYQWWKVKKWALRVLHCLLLRCETKVEQKADPKYKQYTAMFLEHFAPSVLGTLLGEAEKYIHGVWMSRPARQQISILIGDCIKYKSTWTVLKPHIDALIRQYIFPQVCLTDQDLELWEEDPVEYVQRKVGDFHEEEKVNPSSAAEYLLYKIVTSRPKQTIEPLLAFIQEILVKYNSSPVEARDTRQKNGALHIIGTLSDFLCDPKKSIVANQMDKFFVDHVFPEFSSPQGYMRAQAFELLNFYDELVFNEECQALIIQAVLNSIQDAELPVRVYAAICLRNVMMFPAGSDAVRPHVAAIMQVLLVLTREIDMDTLTAMMDDFAGEFPDELAPFSIDLSQQMIESFMSIMQEIAAMGEDEIEKKFNPMQAAAGILRTLSSLVSSSEKNPVLLPELEKILLPTVHFCIESEIKEIYTELFEIPEALMYYSKMITPNMWNLWPLVYNVAKDPEYLFTEDIFGTVDNFFQYGKDVFAAQPALLEQGFDICRMMIVPSDRVEGNDSVYGFLLAGNLLLHVGQPAHGYIPQIIAMGLPYLEKESELPQSMKTHLVEMFAICIQQNPVVALQTLDAANATATLFFIWFRDVEQMTRVHDIKISILSLCSLLSAPVASSAFLKAHLSDLVDGLIKFFEKYPAAFEHRKQLVEAANKGEDLEDKEDEEEVTEELDDDEDGDLSDDEENDFELADLVSGGGFGGFMEDDLTEDAYFYSAVEEVDPYIRFAEIVSQCPADHPLRSTLSPNQQSFVHAILGKAEVARINPQPLLRVV